VLFTHRKQSNSIFDNWVNPETSAPYTYFLLRENVRQDLYGFFDKYVPILGRWNLFCKLQGLSWS
jgi:hypothetical protein